jgi:hypothetical protein
VKLEHVPVQVDLHTRANHQHQPVSVESEWKLPRCRTGRQASTIDFLLNADAILASQFLLLA